MLNPETLKGLFMLAGLLILGAPIALTVVLKNHKLGVGLGLPLGILIANLIASGSLFGIFFFVTEIVLALITCVWALNNSIQRHHISYGVEESHERGFGILMDPETPVTKHEWVKGEADRKRLEGTQRVITEQRLLEAERWRSRSLRADQIIEGIRAQEAKQFLPR